MRRNLQELEGSGVVGGARIFAFGEFELDESLLELRRRGVPVSIEPRALRLIVHLLERRTRMVAKQELFALLWPGAVVSDATLSGALRDARRALGDDGVEQRWIRTRRKLGYRFVGRVELRALPGEDHAALEHAPLPPDARLLA